MGFKQEKRGCSRRFFLCAWLFFFSRGEGGRGCRLRRCDRNVVLALLAFFLNLLGVWRKKNSISKRKEGKDMGFFSVLKINTKEINWISKTQPSQESPSHQKHSTTSRLKGKKQRVGLDVMSHHEAYIGPPPQAEKKTDRALLQLKPKNKVPKDQALKPPGPTSLLTTWAVNCHVIYFFTWRRVEGKNEHSAKKMTSLGLNRKKRPSGPFKIVLRRHNAFLVTQTLWPPPRGC